MSADLGTSYRDVLFGLWADVDEHGAAVDVYRDGHGRRVVAVDGHMARLTPEQTRELRAALDEDEAERC